MHDPLSTFALIFMTLMSLAASGLAVTHLTRGARHAPSSWLQHALTLGVMGLGAGLFVYREFAVHDHAYWLPLEAHVDGLLLMATLLAGAILFLQTRNHLPGAGAFGLPLLSLLLAWAVCASWWSFSPFAMGSVWNTVHKLSVYLGSLLLALAAIAGGMYLQVQSRLKRKSPPGRIERIGSLETIERLMIRAAAVGFALITLGLVSGLIIAASGKTRLGPAWWFSPKIIAATLSWLIFALVMNVRHTRTFRGTRAAWLSLAGFVLLLVTLALATALSRRAERDAGGASLVPVGTTAVAVAGLSLTDTAPSGGCPCV